MQTNSLSVPIDNIDSPEDFLISMKDLMKTMIVVLLKCMCGLINSQISHAHACMYLIKIYRMETKEVSQQI